MVDRSDVLDDRLRAALGGPSAHEGAARSEGLGPARQQVLVGLRRRRVRRLQAAGGGLAVVIALAVALPLALTGQSAPRSSGEREALVSPQSPTPPQALPYGVGNSVAVGPMCAVNGRPAVQCGIATAVGAKTAPSSVSGVNAAANAPTPESAVQGASISVNVSQAIEVTLPSGGAGGAWTEPTVLSTSAAGKGHVVALEAAEGDGVPRASNAGAVTRFRVVAKQPGTAVVQILEHGTGCDAAAQHMASCVTTGGTKWELSVKVSAG